VLSNQGAPLEFIDLASAQAATKPEQESLVRFGIGERQVLVRGRDKRPYIEAGAVSAALTRLEFDACKR
jgi:hypothetical protein